VRAVPFEHCCSFVEQLRTACALSRIRHCDVAQRWTAGARPCWRVSDDKLMYAKKNHVLVDSSLFCPTGSLCDATVWTCDVTVVVTTTTVHTTAQGGSQLLHLSTNQVLKTCNEVIYRTSVLRISRCSLRLSSACNVLSCCRPPEILYAAGRLRCWYCSPRWPW
jgi:hypothetical protein